MPETPEEFYTRAKDALRMPPVEEWETFPLEGDILPPVPEKIWREKAEAVAAALRE